MELRKYKVAGLVFEAEIPDLTMAAYEPFRIEDSSDERIFRLNVNFVQNPAPDYELIQCCNEEPPYLWLYKKPVEKDEIAFGFSFNKKTPFALLEVPTAKEQIENNADECVLSVREGLKGPALECAITNAMMLLYTMFGTKHDVLMMHASAIMIPASVANADNEAGNALNTSAKGFIFLGKSGTGKSTHLQLWLDNIKDTERLNDDNPLIRILDGKPYVFGSPWSGKTPCYKNKFLPLCGVVKLSQAPYNKIQKLGIFEAYMNFIPSCSSIKWRRDLSDAQHKSVNAVIQNCPIYHLECLPDADAAFTCYNEVTK